MAEFAAIVPIVTCDYESSIRGLLDIADEYAILGRKGIGESCARGRRRVSGTGDRNGSESAEHQQESCRLYKAGCENFLRHSTIRQSISIDTYLTLSVRRSFVRSDITREFLINARPTGLKYLGLARSI